jgi:5'-nucleotidase
MADDLILVSNDDGIFSEGLAALAESLSHLGEVYVVAPDRERSAAGHSMTLHRPLRVTEVGPRRYAVDGTPTDCVNLAINGIVPRKPALVMAGVNKGPNLGEDMTYSGTVSVAMEGTLLGVPSVAISLMGRDEFDFRVASAFARALGAHVLANGLPADTILNVNVPEGAPGGVGSFALTRQGRRRYGNAVVEKVDPRNRKYYWIGSDGLGFLDEAGTDFAAVTRGLISITPIHMDLTNYQSFEKLNDLAIVWP